MSSGQPMTILSAMTGSYLAAHAKRRGRACP